MFKKRKRHIDQTQVAGGAITNHEAGHGEIGRCGKLEEALQAMSLRA
jgi:hypothetical protein